MVRLAGRTAVQRVWPIVLRVQILLTSATLSLVAAWRLTSIGQLVGPLGWPGGSGSVPVARSRDAGRRSTGEAMLESWAVGPNSGFWVVPVATAFAGSAGTHDRRAGQVVNVAWNAVAVHFMRRDAPIRQRRSTTWVDQSPILALAVGLLLHAVGPCSALHEGRPDTGRTPAGLLGCRPLRRIRRPSAQLGGAQTGHAVRRWGWLTALRVAYYLVVVGVRTRPRPPLAIVAALSGLSAPSFQPIQQAVLYGFRSGVVNAAVGGAGYWSRSGSGWRRWSGSRLALHPKNATAPQGRIAPTQGSVVDRPFEFCLGHLRAAFDTFAPCFFVELRFRAPAGSLV